MRQAMNILKYVLDGSFGCNFNLVSSKKHDHCILFYFGLFKANCLQRNSHKPKYQEKIICFGYVLNVNI